MTTLRAILLLVITLMAPRAGAQLAPEGNAHPESHMVNATDESALLIPFALPSNQPAGTPAQKRAFAEALDLAPLRDLSVGHNGRVKILDTLARESVRTITGRKDYIDIIPATEEGAEGDTYKPDPLFTLLDMVIDPAYYTDKPLIHVEYLPLRRALLEMAYPGDEYAQQIWNKRTRLSPDVIEAYASRVFNEHADEIPFRRAVNQLDSQHKLFLFGATNLLVVAPESKDKAWLPLTSLEAGHPAREAALELGGAWRALDAERANSAIAALAEVLPTIHPEVYPGSRRTLELTYNRSNAFAWGAWVYLLSLVMLVLAFGSGRRWLVVGGIATLIIAIALHAFGFTARCLIAERFAIQNQFESMTGISLFAALVGLVIMVWRRQWLFGAAAAGTGFLILTGATQMGIPGVNIEREAAILNTSVLLKYHVTTVLTSYGLITLGMIISLFYLGTYYAGRAKSADPQLASEAGAVAASALGDDEGSTSRARLLGDLDKAQMVVLQLAFWTLGVGTLLGAWWADHSWGRWWAFDPKETWALVTWIIYLIVIHARFMVGGEKRATITAWLSVLGFIVMLWTYFGVNLLLPGLHAYA
ncbi:MAG: cytochrome c biogenesis protein CcsA [Phycisphaerales bacterium JB059]